MKRHDGMIIDGEKPNSGEIASLANHSHDPNS